MVIHNSFADFILFLYVHMSQADKSYDPTEMVVIKSKMANLFQEGTDFEQKLYSTIRQYNSFDKSKINALVKESILHFKKNEFDSIYQDIQDIISADGQIEASEASALDTLRQIIDKSTSR